MNTPAPQSKSLWTEPEGGIALAAALLPVCALLASRGVVVVLAAGALLSLWWLGTSGRFAQIPRGSLALLIALLIPWAGGTLFWTLEPAIASTKLATVAAILLGTLVLNAAARCNSGDAARQHLLTSVGTALVGGFLVGAGILAADLMWEQKIASTVRAVFSLGSAPLVPEAVNQGACVLAVMVWPVVLTLWRRGRLMLANGVVIGTGLLVAATPSTSAGLAVAIAAIGAALVYWGGRRAARALGGSIAGLTLLAPLIPLTLMRPERWVPYLPETALPELHRLHLWEFVAKNIVQHPFGGWGFFASRHMPGGSTELIPGVPLMALHPHNGALQAWLELGFPGAFLLAAGLYFLFARIGAGVTDRFTAAMMAATLLAALSIGSLSYGLWQSWWLAALGIAGSTMASLHKTSDFGQI